MTTVPTPVRGSQPDGYTIDIAERSHLVLKGNQGDSPYAVFMLVLMASTSRGGKPIRCTNFVRGVSLLLDSTTPPAAGEKAETLFDFIYSNLEPPLRAWLRREPAGEPFCHEILGITARFAHNSHLEWLPGAMQIDVEDPRDISVFETFNRPPPQTVTIDASPAIASVSVGPTR